MDQYIQPITKVFTSSEEAKNDVNQNGHSSLFIDDRKILSLADLAQGNRNLIFGEPGVGKTELLKKFKAHHDTLGDKTCLVNLRVGNPIEQIDSFLKDTTTERKVLILDALDEVRSSIFPNVLQKIETISKESPDMVIYLSSRWIFVSKYTITFPVRPNGSERGVKLSVGQKQGVAIARAMLRNPKILILDEPTSALDAGSEKIISESFEELMKGRTTFIVAHRLSTVRKTDSILFFKNRSIVEKGTHRTT